ncbi:MAG: nucleotidyltransferase [Bacteroidia bacterium]|nr:nucleotidyltransferase [Bacteroidia bacterium]
MSKIPNYLNEVLDSYRRHHIEDKIDSYKELRGEIEKALKEEFGSAMYKVINSGSYKKFTDINDPFDLDIIIPFKKNRFFTLSSMYEEVRNSLSSFVNKNGGEIRSQRVSIGMTFYQNGQHIKIDVVPGREFNQNRYWEEGSLNLYVRNVGSIKSNLEMQLKTIRSAAANDQNIRNIIRLLKIWKSQRNIKLKSFMIELLVIRAFNHSSIRGSLWKQLEGTLAYIRNNIEGISLKDPGNSSNIVSDNISASDKLSISRKIGDMLEEIERSERKIGYYFPINSQFSSKTVDDFFGGSHGSRRMGTQSFG